jgi:hypothetical protein
MAMQYVHTAHNGAVRAFIASGRHVFHAPIYRYSNCEEKACFLFIAIGRTFIMLSPFISFNF